MKRKEKLQAKGFNYIKLELEADLNRDGEYCDYCDGGAITCPTCSGDGRVADQDTGELINCPECEHSDYGSGYVECDECGGSYEGDYIDLDELEHEFKKRLPKKIQESLEFISAYNDGSVDTEITLTYPVEYVDDTDKVIQAFVSACASFGREPFTDNAGLHISISEKGNPDASELDDESITNFKAQVSKLMAGMILIASGGEWTRGFSFRKPQISSTEKYSAIYTHRDRFLEYRIFDTCYDTPKLVLDYIDMIIGTLKYYSKSKHRLDDYLTTGMKHESRLKDSFIDEASKQRAIREMGYLLSKGKVDTQIKKLRLEV